MSQPDAQSTRHWAPVFGRRKAYSGKFRMITDLRQLNSAWVQPPKFKTDNWHTVGECLSLNPHLTWGAVVDLSNFFFHLGLQDQDQDGDGRHSMDSPAFRSTLLPLLVRPTGPSCGEDITQPGSSPNLVCRRRTTGSEDTTGKGPSASPLVPHNLHMGFPIGSQSPN